MSCFAESRSLIVGIWVSVDQLSIVYNNYVMFHIYLCVASYLHGLFLICIYYSAYVYPFTYLRVFPNLQADNHVYYYLMFMDPIRCACLPISRFYNTFTMNILDSDNKAIKNGCKISLTGSMYTLEKTQSLTFMDLLWPNVYSKIMSGFLRILCSSISIECNWLKYENFCNG